MFGGWKAISKGAGKVKRLPFLGRADKENLIPTQNTSLESCEGKQVSSAI
jgi:hypothetical protein